MAVKQCLDPHPLQGMKVIRTAPHDGGLVRERVCDTCGFRIHSLEIDRIEIKATMENRLDAYKKLKADYRWAMQAIVDLVDAAQKIKALEGVINAKPRWK